MHNQNSYLIAFAIHQVGMQILFNNQVSKDYYKWKRENTIPKFKFKINTAALMTALKEGNVTIEKSEEFEANLQLPDQDSLRKLVRYGFNRVQSQFISEASQELDNKTRFDDLLSNKNVQDVLKIAIDAFFLTYGLVDQNLQFVETSLQREKVEIFPEHLKSLLNDSPSSKNTYTKT